MERPRVIIPDYINHELQKAGLTEAYLIRPAYQRNDYIRWIESAVRIPTRQKRLEQMFSELRSQDAFMGAPFSVSSSPQKPNSKLVTNNQSYQFSAVIQAVKGLDGAYVCFPYDVKKEFGKSRVLVDVTFDGIPYQGSLVRMGTPGHIIGVRKDIRAKLGKQAGDTVEVVVWERSM